MLTLGHGSILSRPLDLFGESYHLSTLQLSLMRNLPLQGQKVSATNDAVRDPLPGGGSAIDCDEEHWGAQDHISYTSHNATAGI